MGRSRKRKKPKTAPPRAGSGNGTTKTSMPTQTMSGQVWLWFGCAMTAFGILAGLQTLIELAKWADIVVKYWHSATTLLWSYPVELFGIRFDPAIVPHLNFVTGLIAIGLSALTLESRATPVPRSHFLLPATMERFARSMSISMLSLLMYVVVQDVWIFGHSPLKFWTDLPVLPKFAIGLAIVTIGVILWSQGIAMGLHAALLAIFVAAFYLILTLPVSLSEIGKSQAAAEAHRKFIIRFTFGFLPIQVVTGLNFASPRYVNYRFILIILTLTTILALSYISRILSQVSAP